MIYLATPLLILSAFPQTYKLIKTKSSKDISILTYMMTWLGVGIICLYAEGGVLIANVSSFIMLTINLILILKYDKYTIILQRRRKGGTD